MNKKIAILLLTIVYWPATKAQFNDNFSDGNFTTNPSWIGDETKFLVENNQLRLQAPPASSIAYLSTVNKAIINGRWDFYVRMEFNPSSANLVRVYLTSDTEELGGALNGYYVQLGGADDDVSLYRQTGLARTKIIDGENGLLNLPVSEVRIQVTRDEKGMWELFSDVGVTNSFLKQGTVTDQVHPSSSFFGIFCLYTSTRSDKVYFDDFNVTGDPFVPIPPAVWKDVILTEIYPNPSASGRLPTGEFAELMNRTDKTISLNGWSLSDPTSTAFLTGTIEPGEYVILTSVTLADEFESFGKVAGISGFPILNNAGDVLVLKDNSGRSIDSVNYSADWYQDTEKKSGGWSLELIDPENPCGESDNWKASEDPMGGTPGRQNSVFANKPDLTPPELLTVIPQSPTRLILTFNEKLYTEIPVTENFEVTPSVGIESVQFENASLTQLSLELRSALQPALVYSLQVSAIRDCNGNISNKTAHTFGLPEEPYPLDIVVNEVLFNPRPTGVDFVELYNPTQKYFNVKDWRLGNFEDNQPANLMHISKKDLLLAPGQYLVVCEDSKTIISHYPNSVRENLVQAPLPALPDDGGSIVLLDSNNQAIDGFTYSEGMHSVFLKDHEGVSLERIAPKGPTQNPENWKSASSTSGFATPGYQNSNRQPNRLSGEVTVRPEIFMPILGQPDFTEIHYQFKQGGRVGTIKILNTRGQLIKQIATNATLGAEGFFRWDGDQENGAKARIGYYVVWFQVYGLDGEVEIYRKRVIVTTHF